MIFPKSTPSPYFSFQDFSKVYNPFSKIPTPKNAKFHELFDFSASFSFTIIFPLVFHPFSNSKIKKTNKHQILLEIPIKINCK